VLRKGAWISTRGADGSIPSTASIKEFPVIQFCVIDTAGKPIPGTVRDDSVSAVLAFLSTEGNRHHFVDGGWDRCKKMKYRLARVEVTLLEEFP
jgi:hypothetical protein